MGAKRGVRWGGGVPFFDFVVAIIGLFDLACGMLVVALAAGPGKRSEYQLSS